MELYRHPDNVDNRLIDGINLAGTWFAWDTFYPKQGDTRPACNVLPSALTYDTPDNEWPSDDNFHLVLPHLYAAILTGQYAGSPF